MHLSNLLYILLELSGGSSIPVCVFKLKDKLVLRESVFCIYTPLEFYNFFLYETKIILIKWMTVYI